MPQVALRELCLKILALRPEGSPLTFESVGSSMEPRGVEESLRRSSAGDLLLRDGESLSMPNGGDYYPDLGLYVGKAALLGAGLRAWEWKYPKVRRDESAPKGYREYPGETDWSNQLDIQLCYGSGRQYAVESISLATSELSAGSLPSLSRSVSALEYAESGYEGHSFARHNPKSEAEIMELLEIANEIFDNRIN